MLYQKNKKLQAAQRGTKNKIKTRSNKNKYTFEVALLGVVTVTCCAAEYQPDAKSKTGVSVIPE